MHVKGMGVCVGDDMSVFRHRGLSSLGINAVSLRYRQARELAFRDIERHSSYSHRHGYGVPTSPSSTRYQKTTIPAQIQIRRFGRISGRNARQAARVHPLAMRSPTVAWLWLAVCS